MNWRKYSIVASVLIALSSCTPAVKNQENQIDKASTKANIDLILTKWHEDAARAKMSYFDAMTSNGIYIGTDASELWTTEEFKNWSKKYFEEGNTWDFKSTERNIYLAENGKTAWFDELLVTWMGTCRGSGVLQKQDDTWKIAHYHLAVTVPNEKIEEVIAIKNAADQENAATPDSAEIENYTLKTPQ
jgi:hypothetical protein